MRVHSRHRVGTEPAYAGISEEQTRDSAVGSVPGSYPGGRWFKSISRNQKIMIAKFITPIATRRNPAAACIPFCPAMVIAQNLLRPGEMIGSDSRFAFDGTYFGSPALGHSWDLGTRNIRAGRHMA